VAVESGATSEYFIQEGGPMYWGTVNRIQVPVQALIRWFLVSHSKDGQALRREHPGSFAALTHGLFGMELGRAFAAAIVTLPLEDMVMAKPKFSQATFEKLKLIMMEDMIQYKTRFVERGYVALSLRALNVNNPVHAASKAQWTRRQ
jgi:hypothetical protein